MVYSHLNDNALASSNWIGWRNIWKLEAAPRVKVFFWKLAHGKLPAGAYLYNINVGPFTYCTFCTLTAEAHTQLLWESSMVQNCWINVLVSLGLNPGALSSFAAGDWILKPIAAGSDESLARAIIDSSTYLEKS